MLLSGDHAQDPCGQRRAAIPPWFSFHQNEFDVVLDDAIRFIGRSQKASPIPASLIHRIRYLVPDDRRQIVESQPPAPLLNRCMQRHDEMFALVFASRKANVANHADQTTSWNQRMKASRPDFIQLVKESVISIDMAQLPFAGIVVFQIPVGRGRNNKMDGIRSKKFDVSCVSFI